MSVITHLRPVIVVLGMAALALTAGPAMSQKSKFSPSLEPVADTHLLMEGLNQANFRGLERILKQKPTEADAWNFARGQALLIAETGNLLLLRPPRNSGEEPWMARATDLRDAASGLARAAANRDYERCKMGLQAVANVCNRCHQTFRVSLRLTPFAESAERTKETSQSDSGMPWQSLDEWEGRE